MSEGLVRIAWGDGKLSGSKLLLHLQGQITVKRKSLCITWKYIWGQRRIHADVFLLLVSPLLAIRLSKQQLGVTALLRGEKHVQ